MKSRLNDSFGSFGVRERGIINETRGTTLHYTIHYTTLHYATLHCTIHCATLYYTCLYFWPDQPCNCFQGNKQTTLHYTILHCTTLNLLVFLVRPTLQLIPGQETHYTTLHCTALHYTTLHLLVSLVRPTQPLFPGQQTPGKCLGDGVEPMIMDLSERVDELM